jgi:hypothetical protein
MVAIECPRCGAPTVAGAVECKFCKTQIVQDAVVGAAYDEGDDGYETGWGVCTRCAAVVYDSEDGAPCAAGGKHVCHADYEFALVLDDEEAEGDDGWTWCQKCNALFCGDGGKCPAGGAHDASESGDYTLDDSGEDDDGSVFRWCDKCEVLFYAEEHGVCVGGGAHRIGSDDEYALLEVE